MTTAHPLGRQHKALDAAIRRRDEGEHPHLLDAVWLCWAREEPNTLEPREPKEPDAGTPEHQVLSLLRERPLTVAEIAQQVGSPGERGVIDRLRKLAWPIVNVGRGHYALLTPA